MRVAYIAICFCILFMAYNTCQSFLTTFFPTHGFYSLFLIYAGFALGSIAAIPAGHHFSNKSLIIFGSLSYCAFLPVILSGSIPAFLIVSFINGLGAGFLWINQGLYVVRTSEAGPSPIGHLSALFFGIWSVSGIIGSLLSIIAIDNGLSDQSLIGVLAVVCGVSCIMLLFVQPLSKSSSAPALPAPTVVSVLRDMVATLHKIHLFFILYSVQQGTNLILSWAVLPTLVSTRLDEISLIFLFYSIAACSTTHIWGRVYDRGGLKLFLSTHLLLVVLASCSVVITARVGAKWQWFSIAGFLCGAADQCNNNLITILVTSLHSSHADLAFCAYRTIYSISVGVFAIFALYVPYYYTAAVCLVLVSAAFVAFVVRPPNAELSGGDAHTAPSSDHNDEQWELIDSREVGAPKPWQAEQQSAL